MSEEPEMHSSHPPAGAGTILVVEDEARLRSTYERLLGSYGYRVESAANGREALDKIASGAMDPQAILLDLDMPVMSGWQLLDHLLTEHAALFDRVLVISGAAHGLPPTVPWLPKPCDVEEIVEQIRRLSGRSRRSP